MKIASIAFTENGAKIVKMLVREIGVKATFLKNIRLTAWKHLIMFRHLSEIFSRNIMRLCLSARAELRCVR